MQPVKSFEDHAGVTLRTALQPQDCAAVRRIVTSTGFFRADEVDVAVELVDECLARGEASGYHFLFAEESHQPCNSTGQTVLAYACFGPIACTVGSYDLYWIAVDAGQQRRGLGRLLLGEVEDQIRQRGGRNIYIETSGKPQYVPTRSFYLQAGYELHAQLADFYDIGDDKVIFRKVID